MSTDTPAAAPITAEREAFERAFLQRHPASADLRQYSNGEYVSLLTDAAWAAWSDRAALSAPVAAQPAVSGVDALWVEAAMKLAERMRYMSSWGEPGYDRGAAREALRTHLSTALTGKE